MVGSRSRRAAAALAAVLVFLLPGAPPAAAQAAEVTYRPPVPGPVIDPFRAPSSPYGPGNRGLDYATTPGDPVVAPADGEVTFAGQVGGNLHVVVLHADGIRTSLSFLASVAVRRGQVVAAGEVVGRAGAGLHFGARRGEEYLDPATLLQPPEQRPTGRVRLVPAGAERPLDPGSEAAGLQRLLGALSSPVLLTTGAPGVILSTVGGDAGAAEALVDLAREVQGLGAPSALLIMAEVARAFQPQGACTSRDVAPPARPPGRRRLVLVAGLGSSSTAAAIHDVDAAALGYAPSDVTTFSYRGGDVSTTPYGPVDTFAGVGPPARKLLELLLRLHAAEPTVPIDVVAHSMGGLVARSALTATGRTLQGIGAVITLATPHLGADAAGGARRLLTGPTAPGWRAVGRFAADHGAGVDMTSVSVRQLAPGSVLLQELAAAGPPVVGGPILAVGARTDLIVPVLRSRWPGQRAVTVDVAVLPTAAHGALPGSAAAARELRLALAGSPPTCRSGPERLLDALTGLGIEVATLAVAGALDSPDRAVGVMSG